MADRKPSLAALYHYLATSDRPVPRAIRAVKRRVEQAEVTPPVAAVRPILHAYLAARAARDLAVRVLVCQPLLRAYCKECGPRLRTGEFLHYVQGQGDIILGADVWLDGKSTFTFAACYTDRPTLSIGDGTAVGHDTTFVVGKRITIGRHVLISGATTIFDSNGHPSDPVARRLHRPPPADEVRPVTIDDDVWIGKHVLIFPGVRIGAAAIVSAGSVVRRHVPPRAVVAGNPAQIVFRLPRPAGPDERAELARRAAAAVDG